MFDLGIIARGAVGARSFLATPPVTRFWIALLAIGAAYRRHPALCARWRVENGSILPEYWYWVWVLLLLGTGYWYYWVPGYWYYWVWVLVLLGTGYWYYWVWVLRYEIST